MVVMLGISENGSYNTKKSTKIRHKLVEHGSPSSLNKELDNQ